jgi:hypothetical protein
MVRRCSAARPRHEALLLLLWTTTTAALAQEPPPPATPAPTATTPTTPTTPTEPATETPPETPPAAPPPETPEQQFKRGQGFFEYRDCPGTIAAIAELAVPGQLSDEKDQLEVHRMLGICHALVDTPEHKREAAREFSSLLSIDPDFQLDPFEVPPHVVEVFETQKTAMKARLDEIRRARAKEDNFDDGGVLVERTTEVRVTPLPIVFVPFGLAQIGNGELGKGVAFGALQGVGLVVNVVGYWGTVIIGAKENVEDGFTADEVALFQGFYGAMCVGLGTLVVGYVLSVGDAWWNREDELVLAEKQTKRPLTSSELKKLKRIERAPDPEPTTTTTPPPTLPE